MSHQPHTQRRVRDRREFHKLSCMNAKGRVENWADVPEPQVPPKEQKDQ